MSWCRALLSERSGSDRRDDDGPDSKEAARPISIPRLASPGEGSRCSLLGRGRQNAHVLDHEPHRRAGERPGHEDAASVEANARSRVTAASDVAHECLCHDQNARVGREGLCKPGRGRHRDRAAPLAPVTDPAALTSPTAVDTSDPTSVVLAFSYGYLTRDGADNLDSSFVTRVQPLVTPDLLAHLQRQWNRELEAQRSTEPPNSAITGFGAIDYPSPPTEVSLFIKLDLIYPDGIAGNIRLLAVSVDGQCRSRTCSPALAEGRWRLVPTPRTDPARVS